MRKLLLLIALSAVLLTACRAESITRLRIDPTGTVTVISEFAFDEEALGVIGGLDDTPEDVLRALSAYIDPSALPVAAADVEPERFERGDLQGIRVTIPGLNPTEVATQLSSGGSIIKDVELSLEDDRLVMAGSTRDVSDFERARLLALVPGDLTQLLSVVLQIEVPGAVVNHTADRVLDDGAFEWDLLPAITDGKNVLVSLEAAVQPGFQFVDLAGIPFSDPVVEPESGSTAWWVAVLPFGLAAAISWFIIVILRRRKPLPEIEGFTPKS